MSASLPDLIGSQKQVAWAEQVREKLLGLLSDPMGNMVDRDHKKSWVFGPALYRKALPGDEGLCEQIELAIRIGRKDRLKKAQIAEQRDQLAAQIEDAEARRAFIDVTSSPAFLTHTDTALPLELHHIRPLVFARRVKTMLEAETSASKIIDCREDLIEAVYKKLKKD